MDQTVTVGTDGQLAGSTDKTKTGWTLGGGAEYALCANITVKAEALWFDLGHVSLRATNPNFDGALDVDQKVEGVIARGGVGYKF
jgi:outer membrane immunogenic protein